MASNCLVPRYFQEKKVEENHMKQTIEGQNEKSYSIIQSPIDDLMLVADNSGLAGVYFVGCKHLPAASNRWKHSPEHSLLLQAKEQLQEYFAGKRKSFSLPLSLDGTDFQQRIWRQIALIPYGRTVSYSDLAKRAGAPHAVRAAGTSTGRNPVAIVIPCHRVVGKDGGICGFAGGLSRKRYLLELENAGMELMNDAPAAIQATAS